MTKLLLNQSDVNSLLGQDACSRVAESVRMDSLLESSIMCHALDHAADVAGVHWCANLRAEECAAGRTNCYPIFHVGLELREDTCYAAFLAFAKQDSDRPGV